MKRTLQRHLLPIILCLVMLLLLPGCGNEAPQREALDVKTIEAALEKSRMAGILAESEIYTDSWGHTHYVLQNPFYSEGSTEEILFAADVTAFEYEGERVLLAVFYQKLGSSEIDWTAWKPQLDFAALLYQGFEDPEEVYRAFCEKKLPTPPENNETYRWDATLPEGYCVVDYMPYSQKTFDENGFEVRNHSAVLRVNLYASYEQYQKIQARTEAAPSA